MNHKIEKQSKGKIFFTKPLNIFIIAVICTALWGSAIPVIKIGYNSFNINNNDISAQLLFAGIRFFIAGIIVIAFSSFLRKKVSFPKKNEIRGIMFLGLIQTFLQYVLFYISLNHLTGVKGSILNSIGNFFAVVLAHFCFKNDKMNLKKFIGCFLGFLGVVICNFGGQFDFGFTLLGEGFIITAAFCFAAGSIITKFITKNSDSVLVTGYQLAFGGFILLITGILFGGKLSINTIESLVILIYLSLLSSAAFALWAQLLKYNHVGKIAIYGFLNPIFGVLLSGFLLNEEVFNIKTFSALFLVSLGILIVNINININKYLPKRGH